MKVVYLVAIFCLSYLVAANDRDCRLECYNAALSLRNHLKEVDANEQVLKECKDFAKKLYYPCDKAVKLILENNEIKKTIEGWKVDVPSDKETEKKVKKYCWRACRNRREN
ncbi:hypothetical protein Aduo_000442 [Ancylostoma duodenale]